MQLLSPRRILWGKKARQRSTESPGASLASALKESKETPTPSCSNHRKEVGKRVSHPRGKVRAEYLQLEAEENLFVGPILRYNKTTPVTTILVCLFVVGGTKASRAHSSLFGVLHSQGSIFGLGIGYFWFRFGSFGPNPIKSLAPEESCW